MSDNRKKNTSVKSAPTVKIPPPTSSMAVITGVFLIFLAFLFYPIISEIGGKDLYLLPNESGIHLNIFTLSKEYVFFAFAIFAVLFFLGERVFSERPPKYAILEKKARIFLFLGGAYIFFVLLSSVLASNKHVVMWGFLEDAEGFAAIFGYIVIFFTAYNYIKTDRQRTLFYHCIFILCTALVVFTVMEYLGVSFVSLFLGELTFSGVVILTFGNQTKFGSMCVLMLPFALAYVMSEKRRVFQIVKGIVPLGLVFGIIASASSAALYALIIEIILIIGVNLFKIKIPAKNLIIILVGLPVVIVPVLIASGPFLTNLYEGFMNPGMDNSNENFYHLKEIGIVDDGIFIEGYSGDSFVIPRDIDEARKFTAENSRENISYTWDDERLTIDFGYETPVYFYFYEENVYFIGANNAVLAKLREPLFPELEKYYSLATGRGYIWLNTLPIIRDSVIIGKGPGNFVYYFPQYEIAGMLNTHKISNNITDKPHSWFLQVAVNSGVVSLLILVAFLVFSIGRGFKNALSFMDYAILIACCVFIIMGAVNDSDICVSPFFWVMLGLCANSHIKKEYAELNTR